MASALMKGVEGVEELLLVLAFVAEKLDVVDQQDVHVAVAFLELGHLRGADGGPAGHGRPALPSPGAGGTGYIGKVFLKKHFEKAGII